MCSVGQAGTLSYSGLLSRLSGVLIGYESCDFDSLYACCVQRAGGIRDRTDSDNEAVHVEAQASHPNNRPVIMDVTTLTF
jgi:hypothetical protein